MRKVRFLFRLSVLVILCVLLPQYVPAKDLKTIKIDSLKHELAVARTDSNRMAVLESLYLATNCQDTGSAAGYINQYLALAQKTNRTQQTERAYRWMGLLYDVCSKNYPRAIYWFAKAAELANTRGNRKDEAAELSLLAKSYESNMDHIKAIENYRVCMELDNDKDKVKGVLGNLGTVYLNIGDYPKAADCFEKAYNIQNEELITNQKNTVNDTLNLIGLLISMADLELNMSQNDKALNNYRLCREYNKYLKNKTIEQWILLGLGKCFQNKKDFAEAIKNYEEGLAISKEIKDVENEAELLNKIGAIYHTMGDLPKAIAYAQHSLAVADSNHAPASIPGNYMLLGSIFTSKKQYPIAVTYLKQAIELYNKAGKVDEESAAWRALNNTYEQMGRTADAYSAYKHYIMLRDSVFNLDKARQLTSIEMQSSFDRRKAADRLLQAKKDVAVRLHIQQQQAWIVGGFVGLSLVLLLAVFIYRSYNQQKKSNVAITRANKEITEEKHVSETLLLNILPADVANELKTKGKVQAKLFDNVSVLMTDFVGFTMVSERLSPEALVAELHACFEAFDNIIGKYDIEKIKTVGDAYVAVSGLPVAHADHALNITRAAIEISDFMRQRKLERGDGTFGIRIGIHSGKVIAGIVGVKKFAYDIWGDTVNTAARMEQSGEEGRINISHATYELVKDKVACTYRGEIDAKNKGKLKMYFVTPNP